MGFLKKFFSHSFIYAIGPQLPRVASIFTLPIITSYLTPKDYGVYGIILTYLGLFSGVSDLGFSVVFANSFFKYPKRWPIIWRQLHFYLIVWSFILSILAGIVLWLFGNSINRDNLFIIILLNAVQSIVFGPLLIIANRYYQFAQKPVMPSLVNGIAGVITIALNLYTIAYLKLGYMGWFISTFVGTLFQFLSFVIPVYTKARLTPIFSFRKRFLLDKLKVALPVVPHNYSAYLLNASDILVMERLKVNVQQIGNYSLAYTFGNYFEFMGNALGMAIGPFYNRNFVKRSPEAYRLAYRLTHWLQFGFIMGGILISLWAKEIFSVLYAKPAFQTLYPLAIILIMGYVYRPYYWLAVARLQFNEKTNQLWKISLIAGILNVVINLLFVRKYGIWAAAISTFISLLYIGFAGYFLRAFKEIEKERYHPVVIMFIIAICTICVYLASDIAIYFKVMVSSLLIAAYFIYSYKERQIFQQIE